jgi:hypothetical protein
VFIFDFGFLLNINGHSIIGVHRTFDNNHGFLNISMITAIEIWWVTR